MSEPHTFFDYIGLSGVIALVGAALGYGRLQQRIDQHASLLEKLDTTQSTLVRLDERLKHVRDDITEIKETLRGKSV